MSRGASDPGTHHRLDLLAARASFWSTAWISAEYRDLAAGRPRAVGRQHCTGQDQGRDFLPISTVWLCNTAVRLQPRRGLRAASRVVVTAVAMLDPRASQFAGDCVSRVSHGRREASADLWFLRPGRTEGPQRVQSARVQVALYSGRNMLGSTWGRGRSTDVRNDFPSDQLLGPEAAITAW